MRFQIYCFCFLPFLNSRSVNCSTCFLGKFLSGHCTELLWFWVILWKSIAKFCKYQKLFEMCNFRAAKTDPGLVKNIFCLTSSVGGSAKYLLVTVRTCTVGHFTLTPLSLPLFTPRLTSEFSVSIEFDFFFRMYFSLIVVYRGSIFLKNF